MLKNCLRTLFVFLIPLLSLAQSGPLTYEDFVHLSEKDKDRFVIKTMELMVSLENAYRQDPRARDFTDEEEKKFSLLLKKLKTIFTINDAYAYAPNYDADKEWADTAKGFKDLISHRSDKEKCVFGGWISKAITINGQTTCSHPEFLMGNKTESNKTPEGRVYLEPKKGSDCEKGNKEKIQCNPVIFGYKSLTDKEPFCVSTENKALNTSFDCMQAALDLDPKNKGDKKEDRLNYIKDRLQEQKNKEVFKEVHEFNYRMCVCDITKDVNKPIPSKFSKDYLKMIQLQQTCYGLMKMIGETSKHCGTQNLPRGMDLTIFEELDKHMTSLSKNYLPEVREKKIVQNTYGAWYRNYIEKLRLKKTPEYVRLCGGKVTPQPKPTEEPVIICKGTCEIDKPEKGKMHCELSINKDKKPEKKITQQFSTADYTDDGLKTQKKPLMIKVAELSKKEINCEITAKTPVVVVPPEPNPNPNPNPNPDPKKPKTYTCEASCVAENENGEGGKNCDLKITSKDESGKEEPTTEKKMFKKGEALEFKPEGAEKAVSCTEIKPDDPKDEPKEDTSKPTIKVTAIEGKETYKVKAVKENDEGWTFGWAIKGEKDVDVSGVSKDWEKKTEEAPKGVANDGTANPEVSSAPDEFLQKRGKVDFKICGQLTKNKEVIEDCALIKKLEESKKPPVVGPQGNNTPAAPPQPMIRRSSDASAVGIR